MIPKIEITLEDACAQAGHLPSKCPCRVSGAVQDELTAYRAQLADALAERADGLAEPQSDAGWELQEVADCIREGRLP